MKQQIENIIKENLPEKKNDDGFAHDPSVAFNEGFDEAIDRIPVSLIADEVLKVVVEKIREEFEKYEPAYESEDKAIVSFGKQLLSNLSPNKENKNNE